MRPANSKTNLLTTTLRTDYRSYLRLVCAAAVLVLTVVGCGDDDGSIPTGEWSELAAGDDFTCGLQNTGRAECWGNVEFFDVPQDVEFTTLDAYGDEVCAVAASGEVQCFGWVSSTEGAGNSYIQLSLGIVHTCGLSDAGQIDCWGHDGLGRLDPPSANRYTSIDVTSSHGCALDEGGQIDCWGLGSDPDADESQDLGEDYDQAVPPTSTGFTDLALARNTSCAIDAAGAVECWGDPESYPSQVPDRTFVEIDGLGNSMCGITTDGEIVCWGTSDPLIDEAPTDSGYEGLTVGEAHGCALRTDADEIVCWGIGDDPNVDETLDEIFATTDYDQAVPPSN